MTKTIMSSAYKGACLYVPSRRADRTTQCQGLLPLPILRVLVRQAGERLHPVVARGVTVTKGKDDQLPAVADGGRLRGWCGISQCEATGGSIVAFSGATSSERLSWMMLRSISLIGCWPSVPKFGHVASIRVAA
jgi:hypothetical protein